MSGQNSNAPMGTSCFCLELLGAPPETDFTATKGFSCVLAPIPRNSLSMCSERHCQVHLNRPDLLCVICPGTARTFLHSIEARKKLVERLVRQSSTSFETGLPLIFLIVCQRSHPIDTHDLTKSASHVKSRRIKTQRASRFDSTGFPHAANGLAVTM